ncbi:Putative DEAD-box ATP-dependent RNA helicase 33 [Apostasia shenzhenica]|uniref:DEAD-box ATP-dependent RNA helicase 33 n=1 Tax=Apostasia shenzhenica TaxID=1088818 RepID=A0A2I0AG96_9ASPA|nr:Putative DEAD-box ATP-dependent RNA helicase 33 [Apostasia shenzhenica]
MKEKKFSNPNLYPLPLHIRPMSAIQALSIARATMLSAVNFPDSLAIPRIPDLSLSSLSLISGPDCFRPIRLPSTAGGYAPATVIRMGGGPRTYPGGVSKWQWKRMQAKKAKQLLKARLSRERQLYEMRKRAELKAAISELERPWELVERAPTIFSVSADEQMKALADRFQRPGGFDMWSDKDGPQVFRSPEEIPSARFFPKGAVHSLKPYGIVAGDHDPAAADDDSGGVADDIRYDDWISRGGGGMGRGRRARRKLLGLSSPGSGSSEWGKEDEGENRVASRKEEGEKGSRRRGGKMAGSVSLRPTTELCLEEDDHGRGTRVGGMLRARRAVRGFEEDDHGRRSQGGGMGRTRGQIRGLDDDDHGRRAQAGGTVMTREGIRGLTGDRHGRRARGEYMGKIPRGN